MNKALKLDLFVVILIVLLAVPLSFILKANFLSSTILFFVIPSVFLLFRQKRQLHRIFASSVIFGIVFGFAFDFLAEANNAWSWAGTNQLVFPYKILGVVSIDVMVWFFFWVFFVIVFYEHFFERDRVDTISKNFKYALVPMSIVIILLVMSFLIKPEALTINYAYFVLGLFTIPPFVLVIIKKPKILHKILKASVFFILLYFIYEMTALNLDQWRFTGEYVGVMKLGHITLPLEELFFWILSSSTILISYHEHFVDDLK